eukprot:scaffold1556_cov278-Prasinococcus_capsulatus_cf.AAC.6
MQVRRTAYKHQSHSAGTCAELGAPVASCYTWEGRRYSLDRLGAWLRTGHTLACLLWLISDEHLHVAVVVHARLKHRQRRLLRARLRARTASPVSTHECMQAASTPASAARAHAPCQ